jgi:predicted RNA-binding Zn ribbon-like protein
MTPDILETFREEPGGRTPAPGPLRLVQRFVNTVDLEDGPDLLTDRAGLRAWLAAHGLGEHVVSAAEYARAIALREAIRALAAAHAGAPEDPAALAVLEEVAHRARLRPVVTATTVRLEPDASGVDAALGRIVAAIHDAALEGTWTRLKACERHVCRWAFYDHSKNRSSHWCSTTGCGAREKNRRAYRRRISRGRKSKGDSPL